MSIRATVDEIFVYAQLAPMLNSPSFALNENYSSYRRQLKKVEKFVNTDLIQSIIPISNIELVILIVCINIFTIWDYFYMIVAVYWGKYWRFFTQSIFLPISSLKYNYTMMFENQKIRIVVSVLCPSININHTWSVILLVFINIDNIIDRVGLKF
jgi:hypothetical protein